ncbi:helix-turn-helix domain-containing protein [Amycolatopsis speibonae]|uniref:Helix-turn-helix domain-containing protein n=1 Tax=Amycolatopsis speibonae TaxID=1450224 RepID=A0ABV7NVC8_9PSEU
MTDDSATPDTAHARLAGEIRRLRKAAKLSQPELAQRIGYSRNYVSMAERRSGNLPSQPLVNAIDTVLGAGGALRGLRGQAKREQRDLRLSAATGPANVVEAADQKGLALRLAETDSTSDSPQLGPNLEDVLSHLREQWHLLVKTDNLLGPRYALSGVLSQLDAVEELLASVRPEQRRDIVRVGAQYAESASWLYEDMCDVTTARRWCSQSLEWGLEADDQPMVTWALFRRSQQVAERNAGQILSLVQAARRASRDLPTPMRAALAQQEAYGLALDGDELQAQTRIDEAQNWAATDINGEARGGHGSFCTPDYLEVQRARCWLALGDPARAIELFEHHVPRLPTVYQRDRGMALGQLAQAYVSYGEPEQAARVAVEALRIGRRGSSLRTVADVKAVGGRLKDHAQLAPVSQLIAELAAG